MRRRDRRGAARQGRLDDAELARSGDAFARDLVAAWAQPKWFLPPAVVALAASQARATYLAELAGGATVDAARENGWTASWEAVSEGARSGRTPAGPAREAAQPAPRDDFWVRWYSYALKDDQLRKHLRAGVSGDESKSVALRRRFESVDAERMLGLLPGSVPDIAKSFGQPAFYVERLLSRMARDGAARRDGGGTWVRTAPAPPAAGRRWFAWLDRDDADAA